MQGIRLLVVTVISGVLFASCNKDEKGNIEIAFAGEWAGQPLVMFNDYEYAFDQTIEFSKSDFYLTSVKLVSFSEDKELLDVELVDLSYDNVSDARDGFVIPLGEVEAKNYDRIDFVIGLSPDQNAGRPEDYPSSNPLSLPRYWEPWSSYIFAKYEGKLDTLGGGDPTMGWAYHTGTNPMSIGLSAIGPFSVVKDGTLRIKFSIDHQVLFGVGDDPIDIKSNPQNHNPTDTVQLYKIIENYQSALSFIIQVE